MSDKQPSLRHLFRRGRHKLSDVDDTSDSNSDSSRLKPGEKNDEDTLPPPLPSAQRDDKSPSARVPKKLQKKRSNTDNSATLALPTSSEERIPSPSSETFEPTATAESRSEMRRKQRRQPVMGSITRHSGLAAPSNPDTAFNLTSHDGKAQDDSSCQSIKIVKSSVSNDNHDENSNAGPGCMNSDSENSESADPYNLSPVSAKSENVVTRDESDKLMERLFHGPNPAFKTRFHNDSVDYSSDIFTASKNPESKDPSSTGATETRRGRKKRPSASRTPSPVSPPQERGIKFTDSPVSPLQVFKKTSTKDEEAPLLPHERMSYTGNLDSPTEPTGYIPLSSVASDPQKGKLPTKVSHKSKIPTPAKSPKEDEVSTDVYDADAAKTALLKTLQKIKNTEHSDDHDEIKTARAEVLRDAVALLELGPRPDAAPPPVPDAPVVSETVTLAPNVPRALSRAIRSRRENATAPGSERVAHPANVLYDKPITLVGGIQQRGFRRWRCCRCQAFTHYENHVCSKLACMHVRCEGECEAYEP